MFPVQRGYVFFQSSKKKGESLPPHSSPAMRVFRYPLPLGAAAPKPPNSDSHRFEKRLTVSPEGDTVHPMSYFRADSYAASAVSPISHSSLIIIPPPIPVA